MAQIVPKLTFKNNSSFPFVILGTIVPIGMFLFTVVVPFHLRVELSLLSDCSFEVKVVAIQSLPFPFKIEWFLLIGMWNFCS